MDGRVERRIRRNNLRNLLNKLEQDKKQKVKTSQAEISRLQAQVKAKDREIYELQNATIIVDTERIWDLEQQVYDLKKELKDKSTEQQPDDSRSYNWTLAARDPYADDYMDMSPDEEHFGDATVAQFITGTPTRGGDSFPTPPATSPCMPATPTSRALFATPKSHAGVQAWFPDPAQARLEEELASLQQEVSKLTSTLDSYKSLGERLDQQISAAAITSSEASTMPAIDGLEKRVEALLQMMSDRTAALGHLTSSINELGFPGSDTDEMITALSSGFRAARLELEYLTPGEITLPLTSHGAEVLDLLLTRLRELATKVKESDDSIDEYHEIEQSLRKQLDARVSVMDGLKAEMAKAERLMNEKNITIKELRIGNDRLKGAVDGYIRDIKELEKLVERMEQEARDTETTNTQDKEAAEQAVAQKMARISELEAKLADAVKQTEDLQKEINKVEDSTTAHVVSMNKRHGASLALRDARVLELRSEIDRVNESLRAAHETIRVLRVEKNGLETQLESDKHKSKAAMDAMKEELQRVLRMSQDFLNSPKAAQRVGNRDDQADPASPSRSGGYPRKRGSYMSGDLARRQSKVTKRRHDSGMGLLEEDEVDF